MKKLLSIILAMALVLSLMPNLLASAAEEEAKAETISYKISSNSISKAPYEGTHFLPTETDVLSENYGKLKFTPTAGTQYADATVANIISNSSSNNTSAKNTSFANSELSLISYRPITFYKMISSSGNAWDPNREYIYDSTGNKGIFFGSNWGIEHVNKVPVVYSTNGPTIDLTKTAPFELYGKSAGAAHAWLDVGGYYGTFTIGSSSDPDSFMKNVGTSLEPSFTIRIKIPENAKAGKYMVKLGNNQNISGNIYGNNNAAKTFIYMTKIDPEKGFEGKFHNRYCTLYYFTDANGEDYLGSEAYDRSAYAAEKNFLGSYISTNNSSATFEKELTLTPGEEYVLYFAIDASAIDIDELNKGGDKGTFIAGGNVYNHDGSFYQNFKLSYIDLIPVDAEYDKSFDAKEETYETHGKAIVNTYAYTDKGVQIESIETAVEKSLGEVYTYTAPEKEGKNFLYWAKGAKARISLSFPIIKSLHINPRRVRTILLQFMRIRKTQHRRQNSIMQTATELPQRIV